MWHVVFAFLLLSGLGFSAETTNSAEVVLQGRVVAQPGQTLSFKTESGEVYRLEQTRHATAIFTDTNVQAKTLLLRGEPGTNTHTFRVTKPLRSVHDGKVFDLFYFCDVCAIEQIEPGPCLCCRETVRLVEKPVFTPGR